MIYFMDITSAINKVSSWNFQIIRWDIILHACISVKNCIVRMLLTRPILYLFVFIRYCADIDNHYHLTQCLPEKWRSPRSRSWKRTSQEGPAVSHSPALLQLWRRKIKLGQSRLCPHSPQGLGNFGFESSIQFRLIWLQFDKTKFEAWNIQKTIIIM